MSRTHDIERGLRSLDAADRLADRDTQRAWTDLERILATDPGAVSPDGPSPRLPAPDGRQAEPRRAVRTIALAGATLMAFTAGVIALPQLSGGDAAFATWTPDPDAIPRLERPEAADDCRRANSDGEFADQLRSAEPVIAERRGAWTTVVLSGPDGFSTLCVTDESGPFWGRGTIGHVTPSTVGYTAPEPRELTVHALGDGLVDGQPLSLAAGTAGSDVAAITYRSAVFGDVTASVAAGHFALWLPGIELAGASSAGAEFEVTYRDGSTARQRLSF